MSSEPVSSSTIRGRECGTLVLVLVAGIASLAELWRSALFFFFLAGIACVYLASAWFPDIGPLARIERIRLSRRGRFFLFRAGYAGALLVVLYLLYLQWFGPVAANPLNLEISPGIRIRDQARFAESFFQSFMMTQIVAVYLLTPAYVAGVIAEEKDRGTLEFLFVSDLENLEIIWSKLASRLLHMLLFLLTGLPVLMLSTFFGGVDPLMVAAGFVSTLFTILSLSGTSLLCSIYSNRVLTAMLSAYLVAAGHFLVFGACCCPTTPLGSFFPFSSSVHEGGLFLSLVIPVLVHSWLAALCLKWAGTRLRAWHRIRVSAPSRMPEVIDVFTGKQRRRPRIDDAPLIWKERHCSPLFRFSPVGDSIFNSRLVQVVVLYVALLVFFATLDHFSGRPSIGPDLARIVSVVLLCIMILLTALRAAYSLGLERDRHTLEGLLTLPIQDVDILWPKWQNALWFVRFGWLPLAFFWLLACISKQMHPLAPALLVLAGAIQLMFAASLGLWLSLRCATTFRAILWTLVVLFTLSAVPPLFGPGFRTLLSPPAMLVALTGFPEPSLFDWPSQRPGAVADLYGILVGMGLYAVAAWGLWWWTGERFGALVGRMPYGEPQPRRPEAGG